MHDRAIVRYIAKYQFIHIEMLNGITSISKIFIATFVRVVCFTDSGHSPRPNRMLLYTDIRHDRQQQDAALVDGARKDPESGWRDTGFAVRYLAPWAFVISRARTLRASCPAPADVGCAAARRRATSWRAPETAASRLCARCLIDMHGAEPHSTYGRHRLLWACVALPHRGWTFSPNLCWRVRISTTDIPQYGNSWIYCITTVRSQHVLSNTKHTGSGQSTAVSYTFTAVVRLMKPSITSAVTASGLRSRGSP
jgi:hypothetical protein